MKTGVSADKGGPQGLGQIGRFSIWHRLQTGTESIRSMRTIVRMVVGELLKTGPSIRSANREGNTAMKVVYTKIAWLR